MDSLEATHRYVLSTSFEESSPPAIPRRNSARLPRKSSWGTIIPPPSRRNEGEIACQAEFFDDIDLESKSEESESTHRLSKWHTFDNIAALGLSFHADTHSEDTPTRKRFSLENMKPFGDLVLPVCPEHKHKPFKKWVQNLERRRHKRKTASGDADASSYGMDYLDTPSTQRRFAHKKSSSGSSFGFVEAVKSASISLASFSVAPRSRRTNASSRPQSKDATITRLSEDSSCIARGIVIDQAVTNRLLQRRRIIEEIISTEEGYVADIRFLMNIYVTLLITIPSVSLNLRSTINRNLSEIIELHEELLGELHDAVPNSEYTQINVNCPPKSPRLKDHHRWRSLDAVPEDAGASWLRKVPGMTAEPKVAADVAKIFAKKMNRFFVYEEYGAKYESMMKDVAGTYRTLPQWDMYQKGMETLASSLASINSQHDGSKKALTLGDLLVKPIQRVCRYPLLFSELLKQTPVYDCPESHVEIEHVLTRLREATKEINSAANNPRMKAILEKTWLLQDRIVFPDMLGIQSQNYVRALGHIHVCGVLYVSWQTRDGVDGQYFICVLYRDFLILASAARNDQVYSVQACIDLGEIRIEDIDNGKGLQCHTAPYSWKLVFECDHQLLEITLTACSPKEGLEWRTRLENRSSNDAMDSGEHVLFTSLSLPIKPLGTVFGKPGTIARRISIHRATTVGPMSGLSQVIIKNTNAFKEGASTASINRSQSLLCTNRIPVLTPSRTERFRLEALLSDVWTRDVLPYPGMTGRAREHLVRASASNMMRKLSVASITSNFTKRSGSLTSGNKFTEDDESNEFAETCTAIPRCKPARSLSEAAFHPTHNDEARLSTIHDERDCAVRTGSPQGFPMQPPLGLGSGNNSTASTPTSGLRRLATSKVRSWSHDGHRMVTPPLRASSANSLPKKRESGSVPGRYQGVTSLGAMGDKSEDATPEEPESSKENVREMMGQGRDVEAVGEMLHEKEREERMGKRGGVRLHGMGKGKNRAVVVDGLRNFFR